MHYFYTSNLNFFLGDKLIIYSRLSLFKFFSLGDLILNKERVDSAKLTMLINVVQRGELEK